MSNSSNSLTVYSPTSLDVPQSFPVQVGTCSNGTQVTMLQPSQVPASVPARVCLVMIVRDEVGVILRCLKSVRAHISCWCIVDTGSTDGTQTAVQRYMATEGLPGVLYQRQWAGHFGAARTEALQLARRACPDAQWHLVMDADDTVVSSLMTLPEVLARLPPPPQTTHCLLAHACGSTCFQRAQVFVASLPWRYVGAVHELAHCDDAAACDVARAAKLPAALFLVQARSEGCRSRDPTRHLRDAQALDANADPLFPATRALYYAAQSWLAAGHAGEALARFVQRMAMPDGAGGAVAAEERYMAAAMVVQLAPDMELAVRAAWAAAEANVLRREAATLLMARARRAGPAALTQQVLALGLLTSAVSSRVPLPSFFCSEPTTYAYAFEDELSLVAYAMGYKALAAAHAQLALEGLPADADEGMRARITENVQAMKL